ncbi:MAG: phytase, partial [Chloroflexota bacterium]
YVAGTTAFARFCSADLPNKNAFFLKGQTGTAHRIFLSGEETSPAFTADHGRVFAHVVTGPEKNRTYELPRLGKMAFENTLASPFRQEKTIVMLNDDAGRETNVTVANVCRTSPGAAGCVEPPSELYMYVGAKQSSGNEIERAGLTNGSFYGVKVAGVTGEPTLGVDILAAD